MSKAVEELISDLDGRVEAVDEELKAEEEGGAKVATKKAKR